MPGTWSINVYKVECGSPWGLAFLATLFVGGAAYVGGGVVYAVRVGGAAPSLAAHPHHGRWRQAGGLVRDGLRFSVAQVRLRAGGGGTEGLMVAAAAAASEAAAEAGPAAAAAAGGGNTSGGDNSSSDDDVVE